MSEAIAPMVSPAGHGMDLVAEQKLFEWSPFGTATTALLIFLVLALLFAGLATVSGYPMIGVSRTGITLPQDTRGALVLSLLIATALGMQRYARMKDIEDFSKGSAALRECLLRSFDASPRRDLARRLRIATAMGVLFGTVLHVLLNWHDFAASTPSVPVVSLWFLVSNILLVVLFMRGLELTRTAARSTRIFIDSLPVDLLRIDQLSLLGRSAARTSLIWFSVSAVSCLFFESGGLSIITVVSLIVACATLGIGIFVLTMGHVHRRIKATKTSELERIRSQIDGVRHEAHASADASLRLQGLIAYEKRIESAPEWPFDQTTAMRLGASTLILTVPWFGQALAQSLIDRVGHFVH